MESDRQEEVPVPGGHEPVLQAHRPDDGPTMAVVERYLQEQVNFIPFHKDEQRAAILDFLNWLDQDKKPAPLGANIVDGIVMGDG
jgi:hypothetical protein